MTDQPNKNQGVLLRARNGDVIGYDETGLRLNLSDSVIADINRRLPTSAGASALDAALLGDIDAWNLRQQGDWYVFSARLPGRQESRQFRRLAAPLGDGVADIFADPSGALFAILSLGGARFATTWDDDADFGYHIVTSGDDLGPAGGAGTQSNINTPTLQRLREQSRDSLVAGEILARRYETHRMLPVIFTRSESDTSSCISELERGPAVANFERTVGNLTSAAQTLGLPAKVLAVALGFTLEDVTSDGPTWRAGMYRLMQNISDMFCQHHLRKPLFTMVFDAGTQVISNTEILRAQWELVWNRGGHDLVFFAPGYMFCQDVFGRPTPQARVEMAEMEACAIEAVNADREWACPLFLLAEREPDPSIIRCRGQGMGDFVLDDTDPLDAGAACGFRLEGCNNGATITGVEIAPDDPQDLLIQFDMPPSGDALVLCYALGHDASQSDMPANRGSVRDTWSMRSKTGATLYRWALPAALPVH